MWVCNSWMKKKRLYELDFIRAFSTLLIILTHFNALFLYLPEKYTGNGIIITAYINSLYIGDWGVALFLIISGAALMYTYRDGVNIKSFYKKRFLTIFPMYWLCYLLVMSYLFLRYKTINPLDAAPWKLLLSFIGMDAYLGSITSTWLCIGEWFLGLIIIVYLLFPIIYHMMNHHERILWCLVLALYFGMLLYNPFPLSKPMNIFVRLPEFCFGMAYIKYKEQLLNKRTFFVIGGVLIIDYLSKSMLPVSLRTTYLGIIAFLAFVIVAQYVEKVSCIRKIVSWICKHSYIIFLIHHRILLLILLDEHLHLYALD